MHQKTSTCRMLVLLNKFVFENIYICPVFSLLKCWRPECNCRCQWLKRLSLCPYIFARLWRFISQLIRYARASSSYECFILRAVRLSNKLLGQGYVKERLRSSLRKFYGRYGVLSNNMRSPSPECYTTFWMTTIYSDTLHWSGITPTFDPITDLDLVTEFDFLPNCERFP